MTYTGFESYRAGTGNDSHSVFTSPQFVDSVAPDLHLAATSPAINAGEYLPQVGDSDIDGEARVQDGVVDIGADERPSPAKPPAPITLALENDSPTNLGNVTTFTATTSMTGTGTVTYTWSFGDNSPNGGAVGSQQGGSDNGVFSNTVAFTHIYPFANAYTAVVSVTDGVVLVTATNRVTVIDTARAVYLPAMMHP